MGCQTITWGEGQRARLPEVFDQVAAAGYTGVEVGYRHVADTEPECLRQMLEARRLDFIGAHNGVDLTAPSERRPGMTLLDEMLDYLERAGGRYVIYSGLKCADLAEIPAEIARINQCARTAAARGLRLLYHNHQWEFADGGRKIRALIENACDELRYIPDFALVHRIGADPLPYLESIRDRIEAVHFRDIACMEPFESAALGEGKVDVGMYADWICHNLDDIWVISEHNKCPLTEAEAARRDSEWLRVRFLKGECR